MSGSGRVVGLLMVAAGLIFGGGIGAWLILGMNEGNLSGSGAVFGVILALILIVPLVGGGVYFMVKGASEAKQMERVQAQRRLLDVVSTRGQVTISDLVLELGSTREQVQNDLHDLVGRGLFTGYVDWKEGKLFSVEASQLRGRETCPNCGGKMELAGKGLIECPFCGAEIYLG